MRDSRSRRSVGIPNHGKQRFELLDVRRSGQLAQPATDPVDRNPANRKEADRPRSPPPARVEAGPIQNAEIYGSREDDGGASPGESRMRGSGSCKPYRVQTGRISQKQGPAAHGHYQRGDLAQMASDSPGPVHHRQR